MPDIRTLLKRFRQRSGSKARDLTMRQVLSVRKTRSFPSWKQWKQLPSLLTSGERRVLTGAIGVVMLSLAIYGVSYLSAHRIEVPAVGGEYTEGLIGEPQFINPLYSISSDVDHDLTDLVYSGLVRWDPKDGFVADLAESIQINEDGTVYTFKIRENAVFHNGENVRPRDVLFTINAIQNPAYRSPLADQFYNVVVVQEDDQTVSFILEEPFTPFLQYLTVGILPASLWAEILPQNAPLAALNLQPVGSGPYKFSEFAKDKRGSIRSYTLERNGDYYLDPPYIETLTFKFYSDALALHDALQNKNVEGASIIQYDQRDSVIANKNIDLIEPFLPSETVLYFNQTISEVLKDDSVRQAITQSIDKERLVSDIYGSSARVIHGPILPGMTGYDETRVDTYDPEAGRTTLEEAGYTLEDGGEIRLLKSSLRSDDETDENDESSATATTLHLTLTTVDQTDMRLVAEAIQEDLRAVGIDITLDFIAAELIATQVVDPRNFELLLAPVHLEADPDPYPFWHSSQAKGVGLNLVGYNNEEVDTLLEEARASMEADVRTQKYQEFQTLLAEDAPAVFLYQSTYGYALTKRIQHPGIDEIVIPADRFAQIAQWYIKTKKALR